MNHFPVFLFIQVTSGLDEPDDHDPSLSQVLCDFLRCTRGEVILMVMTLALRHSLTWEASSDILKMVNQIFGKKVVPDSKYFLKKYFPANTEKNVYHIYCSQCHRYLGARDNLENNIICNCGHTIEAK